MKKFDILIVLCTVFLFSSCKEKSETFSENVMIESFFSEYETSVLGNAKGKTVIRDLDLTKYLSYGYSSEEEYWQTLNLQNSDLIRYIVTFVSIKEKQDKGCVALFLKEQRRSLKSQWICSLIDAEFIPASKGKWVYARNLDYALKDDKSTSVDTDRVGLILMPIDGWLSEDTKHFPMYILSITEDDMIIEKPQDEEFFIYFSSDYDGI